MTLNAPAVGSQRRGLLRALAFPQDQSIICGIQISAAELAHGHRVSRLRPLVYRITTAYHLRQCLLCQLAAFVRRKHPILADGHAPADAAAIAVLNDEG